MRLLLDTNILIPILQRELSQLPRGIREGVLSADAILYASAASLWEIAIKTRIGKLEPGMDLKDIPNAIDRSEINPLIITFEHALAELAEDIPTRDPFDRLLLAQCQVENLQLVTIDRALAEHPLAWRES